MATALTSDQLHQLARHGAMARLEEIKKEIALLEVLIRGGGSALTDGGRRAPGRPARRARRTLSAAGRAAIAAAQKARWAKIKKNSGKKKVTAGGRKRRAMSAAARKAVAERMRKYWA